MSDDREQTLRRGSSIRRCEVRGSAGGDGYELIVTIDGAPHVERFSSLAALLARRRALVSNWRAHGWEDAHDRT